LTHAACNGFCDGQQAQDEQKAVQPFDASVGCFRCHRGTACKDPPGNGGSIMDSISVKTSHVSTIVCIHQKLAV
jgi:hypothetical protein